MMATDEFNSSYGYLLKLMVNTPPPRLFISLPLISPTPDPHQHPKGTPKSIIIQPAFVMLPSGKALPLWLSCPSADSANALPCCATPRSSFESDRNSLTAVAIQENV